MGWYIGKNVLKALKDRKQMKLEAKQKRVETRQEARTERTQDRQETKQIAYQNGVDPNQAVTGMVSNLGNTAATLFGGGSYQQVEEKTDNKIFIYIGAAVAVMMMFVLLLKRK
jgi:hypothetical protein